MSPLPLLVLLLSALLVSAGAAPVSTRSSLCGLLGGGGGLTFDRFTLSGRTRCSCLSQGSASCAMETQYPTAAPGSPSALAALYHRPSSSSLPQVLRHQMNVECELNRRDYRRCQLTEGVSGSLPVCDCAL